MTTSKQYDYLNRLTAIASQANGAGVMPISFNYSYNSANQRTKDTQADGSHWIYGYDSLGQVTNGYKYFYDNTIVPGQQFNYTFDTIGNRNQTKAGGDQNGANQRLANYAVNTLNQITSRDYPGTNDMIGVALATNSVTVNGVAAFHKWEYYWGTVSTNNTSSAKWEQVTVASGGSTSVGGLYVPQTREQFAYDLEGNLLSDGHWNYAWDAENRLVGMTNNTGVGPLNGLTFAYDAKGRRIQKMTTTNGTTLTTLNFVYDGWNPIATLNAQSSILTAFTWGSDLSGSQQGAGGVGGLLTVSYRGTATTNCFVAYDGNGNVASLINAANGTLVASYEYGPFGEVIRQTGPMAKVNPLRFSTKYQDDESDLLYYGYRYYKASTGTWVNRDPLGEDGGENLYAFSNNNGNTYVDALGLDGLVYSSEGRYFFNGNYLYTFHTGLESGRQASADASFYQHAGVSSPKDGGGICNSTEGAGGGTGNSSFVRAFVKNTSKCTLAVSCSCLVTWHEENWAPKKTRGVLVSGSVLGKPISASYLQQANPSGSGPTAFSLSVSDKAQNSLSFFLAPGQSHELYNATDQTTSAPLVGAGFIEEMEGNCNCGAQ